jgi:hypothetical protein
MNILDHISESLETFFVLKILKFFGADPGSGMENSDPGQKFRTRNTGFCKFLIMVHLTLIPYLFEFFPKKIYLMLKKFLGSPIYVHVQNHSGSTGLFESEVCYYVRRRSR